MITTQEILSDRIGGLLSIGRKSGGILIGLRATLGALRMRQCRLVVIARDASPRTLRAISLPTRDIDILEVEHADDLGRRLGRGPVAVAAVVNPHLAKGLLKLVSSSDDQRKKPSHPPHARNEK